MRAVFVFSPAFVPLWSKRFPSVETRAARASKTRLEAIPDEEEVGTAFARALETHSRLAEPGSVLRSGVPGGPAVFCSAGSAGLVLVCPLMFGDEEAAAGACLALALETATQLAAHLVASLQSAPSAAPPHLFWAVFGAAVGMAMPLGTLVRPLHAAETLAALLKRDSTDEGATSSASAMAAAAAAAAGGGVNGGSSIAADGSVVTKTPSWRVVDAGTQPAKRMRVVITVEETIESCQYDKAMGASDTARLVGRVSLWSDLVVANCAAPEITLKVRLWKNPSPPSPEHRDWQGRVGSLPSSIASDTCDLSFTCLSGQGTSEAADRVCHITLCPALKSEHTTMRFEAVPPASMPFRAFYQMKPVSPREAKLLIQLKLNDRAPNSFEFCSVVLPFRSPVDSFEVSPTEGSVRKLPDGMSLAWELGTSIAGRKLECALPMTVRFTEDLVVFNASASSPACYADVVFKMLDGTIAGIQVDPDEVVVYPRVNNVAVTVNYVVRSGCYRVWNSLGETVRFVSGPTN